MTTQDFLSLYDAKVAEYLLARDEPLAGADPRMALLWRWHASEESEHRSTAFELYRALGGNEEWRLRIFRVVSFNFVCDALRQVWGVYSPSDAL